MSERSQSQLQQRPRNEWEREHASLLVCSEQKIVCRVTEEVPEKVGLESLDIPYISLIALSILTFVVTFSAEPNEIPVLGDRGISIDMVIGEKLGLVIFI